MRLVKRLDGRTWAAILPGEIRFHGETGAPHNKNFDFNHQIAISTTTKNKLRSFRPTSLISTNFTHSCTPLCPKSPSNVLFRRESNLHLIHPLQGSQDVQQRTKSKSKFLHSLFLLRQVPPTMTLLQALPALPGLMAYLLLFCKRMVTLHFLVLCLIVVESQQVVPIDKSIVANDLTCPPPMFLATERHASTRSTPTPEASIEDICESIPRYKELLEELKIKRGPVRGDSKCWHCKVNKKKMIDASKRQEWTFACGCSPLKAVIELALVKMEILGQNVGNDEAEKELKRSLSLIDWMKMSYIMEELIGFKANWVLDAAARKAGLQAAADKIVVEQSD